MNRKNLILYILGVFSFVVFTLFPLNLSRAGEGFTNLSAASPLYTGILETYGNLPLSFEPNVGQSDTAAKFICRGSGYNFFLGPSGMVLVLMHAENPSKTATPAESEILKVKLAGSSLHSQAEGLERLQGKSQYFIGNNPRQWHMGVPQYAKVALHEIYPGVDLVYYGNQHQVEHDFVIKPGADPKSIRLIFNGAKKLSIDRNGNLVIRTRKSQVVFKRPEIYQVQGGVRKTVAGGYVLRGVNRAGFQVASYDHSQKLVIDPVLVYSTFLGGSSIECAFAIAVDSQGNAYITGKTASTNFPTFNPIQGAYKGNDDAFVAKINAAGTALVYSTYLGGSATDCGSGIAVDNAGNAYVIGYTASSDFPTNNPIQKALNGTDNVFVAKINAAGTALVYSTYLGGSGTDYGNSIAVDSTGNAYVTGQTTSSNFPVANGIQATLKGTENAFVTKINSAGNTLVYSTYLGGNNLDIGYSIAVDNTGSAYVTGLTESTSFPTRSALQGKLGGTEATNAFVSKINAAGTSLVYSTYLGGNDTDFGSGIAVDSAGNAYVAGQATSTNFPVANALQSALGGTQATNAFVSKINAAGTALVYSTYLGGSKQDICNSIAVDSAGNTLITGYTNSANFPVLDPIQGVFGGNQDAFVSKINAAGTALVYSTYLGGNNQDYGNGIAVDSAGNAYVAGTTMSQNFPLASPIQGNLQGGEDSFVLKISDSLTPRSTGTVTPIPEQTIVVPTATATIVTTPVIGQLDIRNYTTYPNPVQGNSVTFSYELPTSDVSDFTISIYSNSMRCIKRLEYLPVNFGANTVVWDMKDFHGVGLSNGLYIYRMEARRGSSLVRVIGKMVITR